MLILSVVALCLLSSFPRCLCQLIAPISAGLTVDPGSGSAISGGIQGSGSVASILPYYPYEGNRTCGANATFSYCGSKSSCDTVSSQHSWCIPGCTCQSGYVFESSDSSRCILQKECPNPPVCGAYETFVFEGLDNICASSYSSIYPSTGCHCKEGYTRLESYGGCQSNPCPSCGPNQYYDKYGSNVVKTCDNYLIFDYKEKSYNTSGCFCQYDYVYDNSTGNCVLPKQCPNFPQCLENQVYQQSGNKVSCYTYQNGSNLVHQSGCFCKDGYVLAQNSYPEKCVPIEQCVCGTNQHVTAYSGCIRTCDNRNTSRCDYANYRICDCDDGFVWDSLNGTTCVKPEECPNPPTCLYQGQIPRFAVEHNCPYGRLSSTYWYPSQGCYCPEGYVLVYSTDGSITADTTTLLPTTAVPTAVVTNIASTGNSMGVLVAPTYAPPHCIPHTQCPSVQCPANASLRVSTPDRTCDDVRKNSTNSYNGSWYDCFCFEGYVRNGENGDCILPEDCVICGPNQEPTYYSACMDSCETFSPVTGCKNYVTSYGPKCLCISGYVLESANRTNCIPVDQCPTPVDCGVNKLYNMSGIYQNCITIQSSASDYFPSPGCYCKEGYVQQNYSSSDCVPIESCPKCGERQHYVNYQGECAKSCADLKVSSSNPEPFSQCSVTAQPNTCVCSDPFVLGPDNTCIPFSDCTCGPHEVMQNESTLITDCLKLLINISSEVYGSPGCYCEPGYYRSTVTFECVPESECNPCEDGELYQSSSPNVEATCANWAIVQSSYADLMHAEESLTKDYRCFCKSGYARNTNDTCVPTTDCPPPVCPANQEFLESGSDSFCPILREGSVSYGPKCYCKSGFVRDYKYNCVAADSCPDCESKDPNSFYSPCVHCYDYCDGRRNCSWNCLGDCDCNPGFVFDDTGKCTPASNCPNVTTALPPMPMVWAMGGVGAGVPGELLPMETGGDVGISIESNPGVGPSVQTEATVGVAMQIEAETIDPSVTDCFL